MLLRGLLVRLTSHIWHSSTHHWHATHHWHTAHHRHLSHASHVIHHSHLLHLLELLHHHCHLLWIHIGHPWIHWSLHCTKVWLPRCSSVFLACICNAFRVYRHILCFNRYLIIISWFYLFLLIVFFFLFFFTFFIAFSCYFLFLLSSWCFFLYFFNTVFSFQKSLLSFLFL